MIEQHKNEGSLGNLVNWGPRSAIVVTILSYIISQVALLEPILLIAWFTGTDAQKTIDNSSWLQVTLTGFTSIVLLLAIWLFLRFKKVGFKALGFKKIQLSDFGWIFVGAIIYFIGLAVTMFLANLIPGFNADQIQTVGYDNAAGYQLVLAFLGLVIIPPIAEEILFRGFLYRGLTLKWPKVWAAIFSGALFALAHFQLNVGIDVFVLSLVLVFVFEKTKNLWACVILHAIKNFLAFLVLFVINPM